ncbi:RidA family protein [Roseovarius indicus]|jgi:enamine deaminase RidA (YjgF/YER057c/UK114 family)|uniref:Putative endoribonuclease L-PSP n=1 Tax=Roseovarius indicus TaxID=540747 RepID=A0A0T5PB68_9RHOB|nr:RidA family protein [Roseovarius indicus]KRS18537.1 hypothetical protein XM52_06970 [Roseovarius indicus]OAN98712.1 hypothetical protein A8B76_01330 [Roseovarius indicus]QEW25538.1 putative endoribonuclease L-PSP [Roseovarius indicus]SFE03466.1 Enamine deaminase RidA, house cleaning of reactive enamine intermediates, YjgF/YER057c/UK114 family [Roseovarius indicus]
MIEYRAPNAEWTKNYGLSTAALTGRYMFNGAMALDVDKLKRLDEADTVANEVIFCLNKLKTTIGNEGFGPESIVKLTMYLSDMAYQDEAETALVEFFGAADQPLYITIGAGLAADCRVEIEAVTEARTA